jgi:hypothetical protein
MKSMTNSGRRAGDSSWTTGVKAAVLYGTFCLALPASAQAAEGAAFILEGFGPIKLTSHELAKAFPKTAFTGVHVTVDPARAGAGLKFPDCCRIVDAKKRETEAVLLIDVDANACAVGTIGSTITILGGSATLLGHKFDSRASVQSALDFRDGVELKQVRGMGFRALNIFYKTKAGSVTYRSKAACPLDLVLVFPVASTSAASVRLGDVSFPLSSAELKKIEMKGQRP